jgi:arylsulfatase A-like enzyme
MNIDGRVQRYGHAPQDYLTDVVSQKAGEFIDSAASTKQPFMLEVSTFAPHRPSTPAPRYAAAYGDLTYPRTPSFGQLPNDPPRWLGARTAALTKRDVDVVDAQFRERVRADLAVNDLIEHLRAVLDHNGLADNTYFVFSSDNGYHMGEHRLMPGKQTAYDTDINVPLVVTGPGVPVGRVVDQLASNIDLAPTFETLAGATIPSTVDGVSLAPLFHGRTPKSWQQAVLVEHHHPGGLTAGPDLQPVRAGAPPTYTAVRTLQALYVRYADGSQEYYDTATDPNELHNLAADGIPAGLLLTLDKLRTCHGTTQCHAAALLP